MSRHVRLNVVLRLRELAEESARVELAAGLDGHRVAIEAHKRATGRLTERAAALADVQLGGGPAHGLIAAAHGLIGAGRQRDAERERVAAAAKALLDARGRLAEANQRREVVERLRDRILAEERLAADRREGAEANELASARHAWRTILETEP